MRHAVGGLREAVHLLLRWVHILRFTMVHDLPRGSGLRRHVHGYLLQHKVEAQDEGELGGEDGLNDEQFDDDVRRGGEAGQVETLVEREEAFPWVHLPAPS